MSTNVEKKGNQQAFNKQQGGARKWVPFLLKNFNINTFSLTDLEIDNERSKAQMICYPRINNATCVFQTEEINMTQYGIPPLGDFAKTDAQRTTLKFPFDPKQPTCEVMKNSFDRIDAYMEKNVDVIFLPINQLQKNPLKFDYVPIVREPSDDADKLIIAKPGAQPAAEKKEKFKFWKAKLDLDFATGRVLTKVYVKDPTNPTAKPELVKVDSPTDLENYLNWNSKIKMIVMMNKMWADKMPKEKGKDRKYGLGFKILQMEITPREKNNSFKDEISNYAFIVSDNDEPEQQSELITMPQETKTEETKPEEEPEEQAESGEEESGEEESGEEEEAAEPEPEPVKPVTKPGIKPATKPATAPVSAVKAPVKPPLKPGKK